MSEHMKAEVRMHMTATKGYLVKAIQDHGAKDILTGWKGTNQEAIDALQDDPREVIPIGPCDNQDERGYCKGHTIKRGKP